MKTTATSITKKKASQALLPGTLVMAGLLALFRRFPPCSMEPPHGSNAMIEDWLGITTLSPEKWGPSLKNALVGQAGFYKNMLDNQKLRDENNGDSHFKETLRPYFVKGVSYIYSCGDLCICSAAGGRTPWTS